MTELEEATPSNHPRGIIVFHPGSATLKYGIINTESSGFAPLPNVQVIPHAIARRIKKIPSLQVIMILYFSFIIDRSKPRK
jgi:hypothetical protein